MNVRRQRCAKRFAALGLAVRLELVRRLLRSYPSGLVAGSLRSAVGIPASTLSHHLDALVRAGLLEQQREGRFLRYRVSATALRELLGFLVEECCGAGQVVSLSSLQRKGRTA